MKRLCSIGLLGMGLLVIPMTLSAQQERTVTGTVTRSETLQPFPGVEVTVKGTLISTVSDAQGSYALRVPANAETLVFTFLGYRTQEMPVAAQVDVEMFQEAIRLEGVTVTALGVRREKRSLGYSVQDVSGEGISEVPEINIVNSLKGNVAGLQITDAGPTGGSARIVIRGASSIGGNNQPLFIVDGVPIDNSFETNRGFGGLDYGNAAMDVDPANIESISVLKGPNAAALYGARAANGAIVITTKTASGAPGGGLGIEASMSMTAETPLRLPNYQNQYGQGSDGLFSFVDGQGGGLYDYSDTSWGPPLDGRLIDQFTGPAQPWVAHPDNVRSFFRTGTTFNTNVAVSRASERSNLRLSLSNMSVRGMSPGNSIQRINVALNGGATITDRLSTSASMTYMDQEAVNRPGTGQSDDNPMTGFVFFGRQVDMDKLRNNFRCTGNEPTPCRVGGQYNWNYNYMNNPFWAALVNTNGDERGRLIGNLSVDYQINDWVNASARVGRDWYRDHRKSVVAPFSLDDAGFGSFDEETLYRSETNVDILVNATRELTSDFTLDLVAGANQRKNSYEGFGVSVDRLTVPGIYSIDNAATTPDPWDEITKKEVRSVYGSASLNFAGYWNVDMTGRNDWSSTLPEGNNSYFYPSISTALVFTDAFQMERGFLTSGKIRGSWARVGNDADPYQLTSIFDAQSGWGGVPMFEVPDALPNTALKPEETNSWEVGLDLGFLDERVGFVATYYQRETKNQILGVEVSRASGYQRQLLNAGNIENKGVELLLMATPVEMEGGFKWDVTLNWSKNTSEVTELFGDLQTLVLGSYWGMNVEARLNEPYGAFFGNPYQRTADGDLMLDARGVPLRDPQRRVLGNYNPDWIGGVHNRFTWGPWDLSVLLDGQMGGDVYSTTNAYGQISGVLQSSIRGRENGFCDPGLVIDGILPDGTRNVEGPNEVRTCPLDAYYRNFGLHESGVHDASYLKLREVRVGYDLPRDWVNALGFTGGNVSLIGRNLFLWSKVENIDPETAFHAGNVQGLEFGQFPTARSLGFTLSIRP